MCRYGFKSYKPHYVCFDCRKTFKQPTIEDFMRSRGLSDLWRRLGWLQYSPGPKRSATEVQLKLRNIESNYYQAVQKCPNCDNQMVNLGLDFKAPKQSNKKAWKIIQGLHRIGTSWHTCGCNGPGYIPQTPAMYQEFLHNEQQEMEANLKKLEHDQTISLERKTEDRKKYKRRIARIQQEMCYSTNPDFS